VTDSNNAQRIYPTMRCRDAEAMIRWLKDVLGFTEHVVYRSDGVVQHAQLACGASLLMLGQARDALHDKVKASGAKIEMELHNTDYGSRDFACRDPEGNLWSFGTYWPKAHEKPMDPLP
jgi:uncharacterized glyoxalase superfamily protein PhnB